MRIRWIEFLEIWFGALLAIPMDSYLFFSFLLGCYPLDSTSLDPSAWEGDALGLLPM